MSGTRRATFPLPDLSWEAVTPFWDGAAAGELRLPFCTACDATNWYPLPECRSCGSPELDWRTLPGTATLFSFSVLHHVFLPQYRDLVPFVTGLVLPDGAPGARLVTRIVDVDPKDVRCDMPVEVVFRPLEFAGVEGSVMAPLFRPAA